MPGIIGTLNMVVNSLTYLTIQSRERGIKLYRPVRPSSARAEFKRAHPCPAVARATGACPGWVIDHIIPLACGGPDRPCNMQWQTTADAKLKDRTERSTCR